MPAHLALHSMAFFQAEPANLMVAVPPMLVSFGAAVVVVLEKDLLPFKMDYSEPTDYSVSLRAEQLATCSKQVIAKSLMLMLIQRPHLACRVRIELQKRRRRHMNAQRCAKWRVKQQQDAAAQLAGGLGGAAVGEPHAPQAAAIAEAGLGGDLLLPMAIAEEAIAEDELEAMDEDDLELEAIEEAMVIEEDERKVQAVEVPSLTF